LDAALRELVAATSLPLPERGAREV